MMKNNNQIVWVLLGSGLHGTKCLWIGFNCPVTVTDRMRIGSARVVGGKTQVL